MQNSASPSQECVEAVEARRGDVGRRRAMAAIAGCEAVDARRRQGGQGGHRAIADIAG